MCMTTAAVFSFRYTGNPHSDRYRSRKVSTTDNGRRAAPPPARPPGRAARSGGGLTQRCAPIVFTNVTDPNSRVTKTGYDALGRNLPVAATDPYGLTRF